MTHEHGVSRDTDRRLLLGALGLIVPSWWARWSSASWSARWPCWPTPATCSPTRRAIGLALVAMRLAARPATGAYTYGLKRAEILSAQVNGLTLAVLVVVFVVEAVRRLLDPPDVPGGAVAAGRRGRHPGEPRRRPPCSRGPTGAASTSPVPYWHIVTDLFAFIATLVAGLVIYARPAGPRPTPWRPWSWPR